MRAFLFKERGAGAGTTVGGMAADSDLLARIDRLESLDAIRQLAARYCLALDMRDMDALVNLFPADVRVSRDASGRAALRRWFDETLRVQFDGTAHVTGNHIIEFDDPDHARGVVYSRNEHETGAEWVIMTMMYWDQYERIEGSWFFRRRLPLYWYATDLNKPPIGSRKMRWPGWRPTRAVITSCSRAEVFWVALTAGSTGRDPRPSTSPSSGCAPTPWRRRSRCAER
jgi:hypothetical protein